MEKNQNAFECPSCGKVSSIAPESKGLEQECPHCFYIVTTEYPIESNPDRDSERNDDTDQPNKNKEIKCPECSQVILIPKESYTALECPYCQHPVAKPTIAEPNQPSSSPSKLTPIDEGISKIEKYEASSITESKSKRPFKRGFNDAISWWSKQPGLKSAQDTTFFWIDVSRKLDLPIQELFDCLPSLSYKDHAIAYLEWRVGQIILGNNNWYPFNMVKEFQDKASDFGAYKRTILMEVAEKLDANQKLEIVNVYTAHRLIDELPNGSNLDDPLMFGDKGTTAIYWGCILITAPNGEVKEQVHDSPEVDSRLWG